MQGQPTWRVLDSCIKPTVSTSRGHTLTRSPFHPCRVYPSSTAVMLSSRGASSAAIKRLTIEYKQLSSDPNSLFPATGPIDESNYLLWEALVPGPEGTSFEGGVFSARLSFRAWGEEDVQMG